MENGTQNVVTEFILVGFSKNPVTRILFLIMFLFVYILTLTGNTILICAVIWSPQMHTPMYYFLCNLSFLDLFYSSHAVPKMLVDMILMQGRISFIGCMIQMGTGLVLGQTECLLLAVMAFDRYVAICHPLRYTVIMSWKVCKNITVIIWLGSFLSVTFSCIAKPFVFCGSNIVNHFVCEVLAILKITCGDTSTYEISIFLQSLFIIFTPFIFIVASYIFIFISILKMKSVIGRTKAFSTCVSHLIVVVMFYGASLTMYLGPKSHFSSNQDKYFSLFYGVFTSMLNPLIYSLRNKEVKESVRKLLL